MPHDLASDPATTVFEYGAIVSPPKDWERWYDLVRDLTAHLVERYGDEVVEQWSFEVWNEANLEVFWSGTPEEYLKLYDVTAAAVRDVDDRLVVGGPSSAAAGWVRGAARARRALGRPGRLRLHPHLRRPAAGLPPDARALRPRRHARSGGPSGASRRPTSTRSATRSSPAPSCCAGCSRRWAGSSRCPTGWSPTTSRSSAARRPCCTAASGCAPSASCASRAGGRWRCSSDSARSGWPWRTTVTAAARWSRRSRPRADPTRSRCWCGTSRWTRRKAAGAPALARDVAVEVRGLAPGASYTSPTTGSTRTTPTSPRPGAVCANGQAWPTDEQWDELREADRLEELEPAAP